MFLLGRGVVGPAPLLRFGARYKKKRSAYAVASQNQAAKGKGGKTIIQRDAMGRPIVKQREKSLGIFKPLNAGALTHVLFENEAPGRLQLAVPPMRPRTLAPGVAMRFHDLDPTSPMRVYGVPKHMLLEFRTLGLPCAITTSTTLSLIRALEESKDRPARLVLNGRPGVGKSYLLLQAAQYASAMREWIVLYIPRARHFVDASTPYQYSLATRTYLQPRAAYQTLSRLARANSHLLNQLSTQSEVVLPDGGRTFHAGTPLTTLIDAGLTAAETSAGAAPSVDALLRAPFVLDAVLSELGAQEDFPVLIAIDDFQALCGRSLYRDPRFKAIRPHHLSMPRLLLEYAGGMRKLARGLVLTSLTRSDTQFPVPPQLSDALRLSDEFSPSPRSVGYRRSAQLAAYLEGEVEEPTDPFAYLDAEPLDPDADAELTNSEPTSATVDAESDPELSDSDSELVSAFGSQDVDEGDPQWTGWTAYDLPTYEDSVTPTAVTPFPVPRATEEWRTMVMPREEDESDGEEALGGLYDIQIDVEGVEDGADGVVGQPNQDGKKNKKKKAERVVEQPKTRIVRALRAIRVPDALSVREAAGLFEMWLDAGVLRTGGQRRAARRMELDLEEEYRAAKAAVDVDPETAYDAELADNFEPDWDTAQLRSPPPHSTSTPQSSAGASFSSAAAKSFDKRPAAPAAAVPTPDDKQEIARLHRELEREEYDEVRLLEEGLKEKKWFRARAVEDARVESLDAVRERDGRAIRAEENLESEGEEVAAADAEASAGDDLVGAVEALGESNDAELANSDVLELGPDQEIAGLLSQGVRDALADPDSVGDLLRTNVANADEAVYGNEDEDEFDDDEEEEYEDESDSEGEGEAPRGEVMEEDSGADELFLSKYQESSGNARTFVKGLVGTLQTSG